MVLVTGGTTEEIMEPVRSLVDVIKLQNSLEADGVFQNGFVGIRGHSLGKNNLVILDTADDDVCVSDINR